MNNQVIQPKKAIEEFSTNLCNSCTMSDKRWSVARLAEEVGNKSAEEIARSFGLNDQFYFLDLK